MMKAHFWGAQKLKFHAMVKIIAATELLKLHILAIMRCQLIRHQLFTLLPILLIIVGVYLFYSNKPKPKRVMPPQRPPPPPQYPYYYQYPYYPGYSYPPPGPPLGPPPRI